MKLDIMSVVLTIILFVALVPLIVTFVADADDNPICPTSAHPYLNATGDVCNNESGIYENVSYVPVTDGGLSTTEVTLLGLTTLFIALGIIFMIIKQSGLSKKK